MTRPVEQVLLRFDGQYGTGAVLAESFRLLLGDARQRLYRAEPNGGEAAACTCRPISSSAARKVTWCAHSTTVLMCRWGQRDNEALVVVATHPACEKKSRVGLTRVFPGLRTLLHQSAARRFHCCRCRRPRASHRGAFEPVLADEDQEQDPDRWCSHAPCGKARVANHLAMGVEPPSGVGSSAGADSDADHRVCPRRPRDQRAASPFLGLWPADYRCTLESRSSLGARLCASA